jgi:phosphoserine phosphatase
LTNTHANVLGIADGKLTGAVEGAIIDGRAKANAVRAAKAVLAPGKLTIAMGDGANDLPMMAIADLSVAYRAKPAVRAQATICLNHCGLDAVRALFPR